MTTSRSLAAIAAGVGLAMLVASTALAQDNPADSSVKSDLRYLANQMETYYTNHQTYPDSRAVMYDGRRSVKIGKATVRLDPDNRLKTIRLTKDREAYCIRVVRSSTATDTTKPWRYLSDRGGMTSGGCPARFDYVSE